MTTSITANPNNLQDDNQPSAIERGSGDSTQPSQPLLTVGEAAYQAIRKHFHKAIRQEVGVIKDVDSEPVHQMRVGMRRLRTALKVFGAAVALPKAAQDKNIRKLARQLGRVRDRDVLWIWFQDFVQANAMPDTEKAVVEWVMQRLRRDRNQKAQKMLKKLQGKRYRSFKAAYHHWLETPAYLPMAARPMALLVPDLLLPLVCDLLQHPGWWLGVTLKDGVIQPQDLPDFDRFGHDWGPTLHDLRKQIKRVRYQAEFLADFYETDLSQYTDGFRHMQDLLGELQDSVVLSAFLKQKLGKHWAMAVPTLSQYFQNQRLALWQQWQPYQLQYLSVDFRDGLRSALAQVRQPEPKSPDPVVEPPPETTESQPSAPPEVPHHS